MVHRSVLRRGDSMKYSDYLDMIKSDLPRDVCALEKEDMVTSKDVFYLADYDEERLNPYAFLYHGIRFDENFKKLEKILKDKKILAGKHIDGYYNYSDNANKGEYVSMTSYSEERISGFDVFVKTNVCLLISVDCNAILTKYVDYNTWEKIKDKKTKNLYSYMSGEFMLKDFVPFEFVKAIGVPYQYLVLSKGKEYADDVLIKIEKLIEKYGINLKVVDTNSYNRTLIEAKKSNFKR